MLKNDWRMNALYIIVWMLPVHTAGQPQVIVRLMGGINDREGRVEVFYNGTWGTICDDDWDQKDANVVCKMAGFTGLARAHIGPTDFGAGPQSRKIWLDGVNCFGNEASIAQCSHGGWGNTNCDHDEDAGVTCLGKRVTTTTTTAPPTTTTTAPPRICDNPTDDIRLVGGENEATGQVHVRHEGTWGAICDDFWGQLNAAVICRALCYNPANARAHLGGTFGNASAEIILDDVKCIGNESTISACRHRPWNSHNCDVTEAAGVSCLTDEPPPPPVPSPIVECEDERIAAKFLLSDEPRLRPEHLTLAGNRTEDCGYTLSVDSHYVTMTIPFIGCGTTREANGTHFVYSNTIVHSVPPASTQIRRSTVYTIVVSCVNHRNHDPETNNNVEPIQRTAPPRAGSGDFDVQMYLYRSRHFRDMISVFPAKVTLGGWLYVGISLVSSDPRLKVILLRCYATPRNDPESEPKYFFIRDKCGVEDSVTFIPYNQTLMGFGFRTFTFTGNYTDQIYLHCKAIICDEDEKTAQCDRSCAVHSGRRKRDVDTKKHLYDLQNGPLYFVNEAITVRGISGSKSSAVTTGHTIDQTGGKSRTSTATFFQVLVVIAVCLLLS